jgi:hypothetical protein
LVEARIHYVRRPISTMPSRAPARCSSRPAPTAALALGAWEDLEEYGIADPDDVIRRTFRQRWLASAERRHDWACYTAAVATLASPNCDGPLDVIEPPETVVGFLLNGQEIDVLHIPSPGWR